MADTGVADIDTLIDRAKTLTRRLRERAPACEEARRVSEETMADLRAAGLFRVLQPARYGGIEGGLDDFVSLVELIARGCGSTGWVYSVAAIHQWQIAMYPAEAQEEVWGEDGQALASSSYVPSGAAEPVDGGWRLSGFWNFCSGCDNTQWMIVGGRFKDGDAPGAHAFFLIPRADYRIEDNWHVLGLAGTGSKNVVVEDAFVPAHRVLTVEQAGSGKPPGAVVNRAPVYRVPFPAAVSTCLAAPPLGMAQGALDSYVEGLSTRTTRGAIGGAGRRVAELPTIQLRVAEAAAAIDAARLLLLRGAREAVDTVARGEPLTTEFRVRTRRDHAFAVRLSVQAVDRLFEAVGGLGLFSGNDIQRAWRDVHAGAKHISTNWDAVGTLYGRFALGLEPEGGHY
jgi:alkylation response protein AidB-like acyl-CoA dehydrogenase